ncbi:UNVERIFIED_CONTAM: hypothetical protein GTU68_063743 [Idotea baltica]|nr:hypothetical protein [Idotea baltica]
MIQSLHLTELQERLRGTPLEFWGSTLEQEILKKTAIGHGDIDRWFSSVKSLPNIDILNFQLSPEIQINGLYAQNDKEYLIKNLKSLSPWRKGPFKLFDIHIDSEWRSDWKWQRLKDSIDLTNKRVLDVGCGNGYHLWRMLDKQAHSVIGIDPNWLFTCQFLVFKKYLAHLPVWHLPLALEDLPDHLEGFDTIFSMGVLYHRKSPIDHLTKLYNCLLPSGELILETLVIDGNDQHVLVPPGRYAKMRNVWFIPSVDALICWLERIGFIEVECINISITSEEEQRTTDWMHYQSLVDFLHPEKKYLTIENLPAPKRAILKAKKTDHSIKR